MVVMVIESDRSPSNKCEYMLLTPPPGHTPDINPEPPRGRWGQPTWLWQKQSEKKKDLLLYLKGVFM